MVVQKRLKPSLFSFTSNKGEWEIQANKINKPLKKTASSVNETGCFQQVIEMYSVMADQTVPVLGMERGQPELTHKEC